MRRDLSKWFGSFWMAGRKTSRRRNNRSLKARNAAARISLGGVEALDPRKMLAVTAALEGTQLVISLDASDDVAGLVSDGTEYEVFDGSTSKGTFTIAGLTSIKVQDTGEDATGQVFEVRDGNAIVTALGVLPGVETTEIYDDIAVATGTFDGTHGVIISSPEIFLDDDSLADPLVIGTANTDLEFVGRVTILGGSNVAVGTGAGAGDIDFVDDVVGGEDSGTLTLSAGTGAINFGGDVGATPESGEDEPLAGVRITDAASAAAVGLFYLDGSLPVSFDNGITIEDGINNVNFSNGGLVFGFGAGEDTGAGIRFTGSSTNSTIANFQIGYGYIGIEIGNDETQSDLSGTVIRSNQILLNEWDGISINNVAGGLNGLTALVIGGEGGEDGNLIQSNGYDGIYSNQSTGIEIVGNNILANGFGYDGNGISLEAGGAYLIADNLIGEALGSSPGNAVHGIAIDGEDGFYSYAGTIVADNEIRANIGYGIAVDGVTADTGEDAILIAGNEIVENLEGGIQINASDNIRIIFNEITFNGEDTGNGIVLLAGSQGIVVFSNTIASNAGDGIYGEDSSTLSNPVRIGDAMPVVGVEETTLAVEGDQRAYVFAGQEVILGTLAPFSSIADATVETALVMLVSYDAETDQTLLSFEGFTGTPTAVSLGNLIEGNGEDFNGHGVNFFASGEDEASVVEGVEILGNIVIGNGINGINFESASNFESDPPETPIYVSGVVIAGNFIGREPLTGEDVPNGLNGIYISGGEDALIVSNYISGHNQDNPFFETANGIHVRYSEDIDVGEDGFGNYIARNEYGLYSIYTDTVSVVDNDIVDNSSNGVYFNGSSNRQSNYVIASGNRILNNGSRGIVVQETNFVEIDSNLIQGNAAEGIDVDSSSSISVTDNQVSDNGGQGIDMEDANNVTIEGNFIAGNGGTGVDVDGSTDVYAGFNVIEANGAGEYGGHGVRWTGTNGVVEGNKIVENSDDGVSFWNDGNFSTGYRIDVLGNIIRENGGDGVSFEDGNYYGEDLAGDFGRSHVAGNTIEQNDDGVYIDNVTGVLIGVDETLSPSHVNVINLNYDDGIDVNDLADIFVVGNEISSNAQYGVELDNAEDAVIGYLSDLAETVNTIRRNGIAGVYATGSLDDTVVIGNEILENPVGVMLTGAAGLQLGGSSDVFGGEAGNWIYDNDEGIRATSDSTGTFVQGNLIEGNLTGVTLAGTLGLTFGVGGDGEDASAGNTVVGNNEGLRASGLLTDTAVAGNAFIDNTKVGIALQSARDLTVGGLGEDSPNVISGSAVGLSASGTMTGTEVVFNEFTGNVIGISLSKATGMLVAGNTLTSLRYGISVAGNNVGTEIVGNTIANTGDGPYAGSGIYLNAARNVDILGNMIEGSSLAGLYATGNSSGTVVEGNTFTDNRIGMFLENASNAVFGGSGEGEGNTIVGGGDPASGEYRDGILVVGGTPGSSITGTDITDASTGVWLRDSQDIEITDTFVTGAKFYGFNASGDLTGSSFYGNAITNTVGISGGLGHAIHLEGAQGLAVYDNLGEDSFGSGVYVTGDTTGTTVENNLLIGNRVGISLINATSAVIGGDGEDQANYIFGGSDAADGVYRDGIQVVGTSTESFVTGTEIDAVTTGVILENATGITVSTTLITGAEFLGVNAAGTLTGSSFEANTVSNTGGLGGLGHGIYLANAAGLSITDNLVEDSTGGGLYVTGVTTGTEVYFNAFEGNRVGIYLENATDAVIGGDGEGEDNLIVGGGDASTGDFRDGILATGTLTGSIVTQTVIENTATGITLNAAVGIFIVAANVTGSQIYGLSATGILTDTAVIESAFSFTAGDAGGGVGVLLSAAQQLLIEDTTIEGNVIGLLATGDCSGSAVIDATWTDNETDLINESTGVPPLDIDPLP